MHWDVKINSTNAEFLTKLNAKIELIDLQTNENMQPNTWIQTDILVHKTNENSCPLGSDLDAITISESVKPRVDHR